MTVATSHLKNIKMFLSVVPVSTLGKIIFKDYDWSAKPFGGGEDWFSKFRAQWRKVIEIRWGEFIKERKKELLATGIRKDFELYSFPEMPNRPWADLWGGIPFGYELTGGFLSWYTTELFPKDQAMLNFVMMEGIFIKNENRSEYADALDRLTKAVEEIQKLLEDLDFKGTLGVTFDEFASASARTIKAQSSVENLISQIESTIKVTAFDICNAIRTLEILFKGIFEEYNDGIHSTLQNMISLKGHENIHFKDNLRATRHNLIKVLYYLSELEPIDKN